MLGNATTVSTLDLCTLIRVPTPKGRGVGRGGEGRGGEGRGGEGNNCDSGSIHALSHVVCEVSSVQRTGQF